MTALDVVKMSRKSAKETFEGTVADVTDEELYPTPGGKALPLGSIYAHVIFSEDAIVNGMMQGKAPLFKSSWEGKTGTDKPMPEMDENWSKNNEEWSHSVKIDLPKLKEYQKAVFATTDEYLNSLSDEDLEKEIDLGSWGKKKVVELFDGFINAHMNSITGEISALKGIQGLKGYPF